MNNIIGSNLSKLQNCKALLINLSDTQFGDKSVSPYYSSIGTHIRHILDFYDCIFNINSENKVDLTARARNLKVESNCNCAQEYLDTIFDKLNAVTFGGTETVLVIDDLGLGKTEIFYTYGSLLAQANSHTIHHFAIINYILDGLGISLQDATFGYNPTTPIAKTLN